MRRQFNGAKPDTEATAVRTSSGARTG